MGIRRWIGEPLDLTEQYITERPHKGKTVAGTSKDDLGKEMTDAVPSFIDKNDYTTQELNQIAQKILNPELSLRELTDRFGWNYASTSSFLSSVRDRYADELREGGLYRKMTFPGSPDRANIDSAETKRKRGKRTFSDEELRMICSFWDSNPDATSQHTIDVLDLPYNKNQVSGLKSNWKSGNLKYSDAGAREVDTKERQLEVPNSSGNGVATVSLSYDSLFTIVNSREIPEVERREIFEQLVG